MLTLSRVTLLFAILAKVTAQPITVATSLTPEWTATLGLQTPGITPLFTKLDNGVAVASILQDNSTGEFELHVRTFESQSGVEKGNCKLPLTFAKDRVWETRLMGLGDSRVVVSWLYNEKDKAEGGIKFVVVDLGKCESREVETVLYEHVNFIHYVSHAVVPYRNGSFDLFVKSPMLCEDGICRVRFGSRGERLAQDSETNFFASTTDDSVTWSMARVNDSSECFYHVATDTSRTRITQFASNGTRLGLVEVDTRREDEALIHSGGHGNLGFCFGNSTATNATCLLFDSALNKKIEVSVKVCEKCKDFGVPLKRMSMVNTKDDGFLLLTMSCASKMCDKHVTTIRKVEKDGTVGTASEFMKSKEGCFPRSNYELFEINAEGDYFCSGFPCMNKPDVDEKVYDVSVHTRCLKST